MYEIQEEPQMKKLVILLAALLILSVSLIACASPNDDEEETSKTPNEIVDSTGEDETTGGEETSTDDNQGTDEPEKTYTFTALEESVNVYALTNLNLREQPSFADSVAKKSVPTGTALIKIAESNETSIDSNDNEYKWFKVKYEDQEYYVKSTLVTSIEDPDDGFVEVTKTLYAKGSLKVRVVPSMENEAAGYINAGDAVKIIAENTATGWYKIEFEGKYTPKGEYYVTANAEYWSETPIEAEG